MSKIPTLYMAIGAAADYDFTTWSPVSFKMVSEDFHCKNFRTVEEMQAFTEGFKFSGLQAIFIAKESWDRIQKIINGDPVQDFIEKNYPKYNLCDTVAAMGDLHKLINEPEEVQCEDCAHDRLIAEILDLDGLQYMGDDIVSKDNWRALMRNPEMIKILKTQYNELRIEILETAIANSLLTE